MPEWRAWTMRYSGHLGLRAPDAPLFRRSAGSNDPVAQIEYLAELGFAGVQDNFLKLRTPHEQSHIGQALADRALTMGTFVNNPARWNAPLWGATDRAARATLSDDLNASIEAAARTGGACVTCVSGYDRHSSRPAQQAAMADNLSRLAPPAQVAGIRLCVEPVAEKWLPGSLVDRLADAAAIVRAVNHPAVQLLFDIGHVQMGEGDILANLDRCWDIVGAIQAADTPGRIDLGAGELNWPNILRWIRARGYTGLIEIEHLPMHDSAAGERQLLDRLRAVDALI